MYCKNCGTKIHDGDLFCSLCGNRVVAQGNAADGCNNRGNNANSNYSNSFSAQPVFSNANEAFSKMKNKMIESVAVLATTLLLLLIGIIMMADDIEAGVLPFLIGFAMIFVWMLRYMFFATLRNILWLKKRGLTNVGADIDPSTGARLCAGSNAFFETKQKILIPYSETIWVYKMENRVLFLFIPIIKVQFLIIKTRDGKTFKLKAKPEDFMSVYDAHFNKFPREFMIGFTPENGRTYKDIKRKYKSTGSESVNHVKEQPQTLPDNNHQRFDENLRFCMIIEDKSELTGRGTVVTGKIQCGEIHSGQEIEIIDHINNRKIVTVVAGIEMFGKILNEAKQGDVVGLLLRGLKEQEVPIGSKLIIGQEEQLKDETTKNSSNFMVENGVLMQYTGYEDFVDIPSTVTEIAPLVFARKDLRKVTIPNSVIKIGHHAFAECASLEQVTIPGNVKTLEEGLFIGCSNLAQAVLQDGVKEIGNAVFFDCTALETITIPDSVVSIGEMAFQGAKLKALYLPDSVKKIGESACINCTSLEEVHLSDSLEEIPGNMFERCVSLNTIDIPNKVGSIGKGAFLDCTMLSKISLPQSVCRIGKGAFFKCFMLKTVEYAGTQEERNQIQIEDLNLELEKANWIYRK